MEVCGAPSTCGAYCDRHAQVAYRVMPTKRRNRGYHKDDQEFRNRLSHEADALLEESTFVPPLDDEVLMVPHFIGVFDE